MSNFMYEFSSIKKAISFYLEDKMYTKKEVDEHLRNSFKLIEKIIDEIISENKTLKEKLDNISIACENNFCGYEDGTCDLLGTEVLEIIRGEE